MSRLSKHRSYPRNKLSGFRLEKPLPQSSEEAYESFIDYVNNGVRFNNPYKYLKNLSRNLPMIKLTEEDALSEIKKLNLESQRLDDEKVLQNVAQLVKSKYQIEDLSEIDSFFLSYRERLRTNKQIINAAISALFRYTSFTYEDRTKYLDHLSKPENSHLSSKHSFLEIENRYPLLTQKTISFII